jgi:polyphosphate kinase 2
MQLSSANGQPAPENLEPSVVETTPSSLDAQLEEKHHHPKGKGKPADKNKQKKKGKGKHQPLPLTRFTPAAGQPLPKSRYKQELARLQLELVKLQYWIKHTDGRVVIIFEGRDAAGKGGVIKRITDPLNPRGCQIVALGRPSDREKTQWYFQRYVSHLPAAGEIVLFDRSWYNRAGVERVMQFCTDPEYWEFMQSCPEFERMLVRSGIILLKYWFSVSDEEQERRFQSRAVDPARRWKLSPMDLESRDRWVEYSQAKDEMFAHTNIPEAPWFTVEADDKCRARLNCIRHILTKIPYEDITPDPLPLPPRKEALDYQRPPINEQFFVPQFY